MFKFVSLIVSLVLLCGCRGESEPELKLERILITPWPIQTVGGEGVTLAEGNSQPFRALGVYSNGLARPLEELNIHNWVSSDNNVGFFSEPGLLVGGSSPGEIEVTAHFEGITSNFFKVTVTNEVILSVTVMPGHAVTPEGLSVQFEAFAHYSDGTSYNKTKDSEWVATNESIASITTSGLATGGDIGSSNITATINGITSYPSVIDVTDEVITSISITPQKSTLLAGFSQQLTAIGIFSQGTSKDITNDATWRVIDEKGVISISNEQPGEVLGAGVGQSGVMAEMGAEKSETTNIHVCEHLGEVCIDVFELEDNTLHTSSPSEHFLDSISYRNYSGSVSDYSGEVRGRYALFHLEVADSLCNTYNDESITLAGRRNWRVPTAKELELLWLVYGGLERRMWPVGLSYISNDSFVNLSDGTIDSNGGYVSCISSPE